jgi:hypothetical protein
MKSLNLSLNVKAFFAILVLALGSLACGAGDITALLDTMPKDDFSNSSSGWGTGTDADSSVEYSNDALDFKVFTPYYVTWSTPSIEVYENTHLEVNVQNNGTDPESFFGFVCNEQGTTNAFYYIGVSPDGYYAFMKSKVVGDDEVLKEGTSDIISSSAQSMRLGLDCKNGSIALYVNGQQIDSVSDSSYTSGTFGLFAASDDEQNGTAVVFDDFASSKIE